MNEPRKKSKYSGRKPGVKNKFTADARAAVMAAFDKLGGIQYLVNVGKDNPAVFCNLLGKLIPKEINANVSVVDQYFELLKSAQNRAIEHERTENRLRIVKKVEAPNELAGRTG